MLESTEKGEVRKTVGNYRLILMNDPNLQGAFRLNMFTDKIDITRDLGWYRESDSLTDVDLKFLVVYLEKHYGLSNEKRIEDVIKVVANENRYHPVLDRINSITWDGWERIRYALHHFLGAEVSEYTYEVMKLFMIGRMYMNQDNIINVELKKEEEKKEEPQLFTEDIQKELEAKFDELFGPIDEE